MKRIIVTLLLLILTNLTVVAKSCVTGYACSLSELKDNQNREILNENMNDKNDRTQQNEDEKSKKNKKSIFIDGGKYNSPAYTEMFTFRGGMIP